MEILAAGKRIKNAMMGKKTGKTSKKCGARELPFCEGAV